MLSGKVLNKLDTLGQGMAQDCWYIIPSNSSVGPLKKDICQLGSLFPTTTTTTAMGPSHFMKAFIFQGTQQHPAFHLLPHHGGSHWHPCHMPFTGVLGIQQPQAKGSSNRVGCLAEEEHFSMFFFRGVMSNLQNLARDESHFRIRFGRL